MMEHEIHNQDEALEVIAAYLERMGVTGLRQPHDPDTFNKSAVLRYLIAEKLQEVLDNPPLPDGEMHRMGQGTRKKRKQTSFPEYATQNRRKGSQS